MHLIFNSKKKEKLKSKRERSKKRERRRPDPWQALVWPATETHSWVLSAIGLLKCWPRESCSGRSNFLVFSNGSYSNLGLVFWFFHIAPTS